MCILKPIYSNTTTNANDSFDITMSLDEFVAAPNGSQENPLRQVFQILFS
jgi:hypothetical protein